MGQKLVSVWWNSNSFPKLVIYCDISVCRFVKFVGSYTCTSTRTSCLFVSCLGSSVGLSQLGSNWLSPSNTANTLPGGHIRYRYAPGDLTMRLPSSTGVGSHWLDNGATTTRGPGSLLPTGFASPGGHPGRQYLTLTTRERSSSTPNVSNNVVSPISQVNLIQVYLASSFV